MTWVIATRRAASVGLCHRPSFDLPTEEECLAAIDAIRDAIRPEAMATLWTAREFKKTRLQLFTPDYVAWEAGALEAAR